jgi:hypothetical protein
MPVYCFRPAELDELHEPGSIELAERLTRRRFVLGVGERALGAISSCGAPSASTPTSSAPALRQLTDALGEVVSAPTPPQRIISVWGYGSAAILEPGGSVIGGTIAVEPLLEQDLRATFDLSNFTAIGGEAGQPNLEQIAADRAAGDAPGDHLAQLCPHCPPVHRPAPAADPARPLVQTWP